MSYSRAESVGKYWGLRGFPNTLSEDDVVTHVKKEISPTHPPLSTKDSGQKNSQRKHKRCSGLVRRSFGCTRPKSGS